MLPRRKRNALNTRQNKGRTELRVKPRREIHPYDDLSSESETDDETTEKLKRSFLPQFGADHILVTKLLKYAKVGNPTATVLALVALLDLDLSHDALQRSVLEAGGVEVLVRLVRSRHLSSKVASLRILLAIAGNRLVCDEILRCQGVVRLVDSLRSPDSSVASLAASTIGRLSTSRRVQKEVRRGDGLKLMIHNLCKRGSIPSSLRRPRLTKINAAPPPGTPPSREELARVPEITSYGVALWRCCENPKSRAVVVRSTVVKHIRKFIDLGDDRLMLALLGIVEKCTVEPTFRQQVMEAAILIDVIDCLSHFDEQMRLLATRIVFNCGNEAAAKDSALEYGGVDALLGNFYEFYSDKELVEATCGAIARLMDGSALNTEWFKRKQIATDLDRTLRQNVNFQLKQHCLDGMRLLFPLDDVFQGHVIKGDLVSLLSGLIQQTEAGLLVSSMRFVAVAAEHAVVRSMLLDIDALRLCWSHLKSKQPSLVAVAGDAIHSLILSPEATAETIRSFVGGLDILVKCLDTDDKQVVSSLLYVVAMVALDAENASILVEYGLLSALAVHCGTNDMRTRDAICLCIANFPAPIENDVTFQTVTTRLCSWMGDSEETVKWKIAHALKRLSTDPGNCFIMHRAGVVKPLLAMMATDDEHLQRSIASCVREIRLNAVRSEEERQRSPGRGRGGTTKRRPPSTEQGHADSNSTVATEEREGLSSRLSGFSDLSISVSMRSQSKSTRPSSLTASNRDASDANSNAVSTGNATGGDSRPTGSGIPGTDDGGAGSTSEDSVSGDYAADEYDSSDFESDIEIDASRDVGDSDSSAADGVDSARHGNSVGAPHSSLRLDIAGSHTSGSDTRQNEPSDDGRRGDHVLLVDCSPRRSSAAGSRASPTIDDGFDRKE